MSTTGTRTSTVRAVRWDGGWELHIDDVGVTQVRTLAHADTQVRDYLESLLAIDASNVEVVVVPISTDWKTRPARPGASWTRRRRRRCAPPSTPGRSSEPCVTPD